MSTFLTISIIIAGQVTYPTLTLYFLICEMENAMRLLYHAFFWYVFTTLSASLYIVSDIMLALN